MKLLLTSYPNRHICASIYSDHINTLIWWDCLQAAVRTNGRKLQSNTKPTKTECEIFQTEVRVLNYHNYNELAHIISVSQIFISRA